MSPAGDEGLTWWYGVATAQVVPGELTIITGVPNSGKSEWIDALLTNLTHLHGWSFALCSMEKKVTHPLGPTLCPIPPGHLRALQSDICRPRMQSGELVC